MQKEPVSEPQYLWQDVPTRLVGWITKNTCHLFSVWHGRGMFACDLAWGSQQWEAGSYHPHCFHPLGRGRLVPDCTAQVWRDVASPRTPSSQGLLVLHLISVKSASKMARSVFLEGGCSSAHCKVSSIPQTKVGALFL